MKKFLLGTNWKMNKSTVQGMDYTKSLMNVIQNHSNFDFFIIPPAVQLWGIKHAIDEAGSPLMLGAQNVHYEDCGQFTGELSPTQLKEIGLTILEIGHSERRQYFNETDYTVNLKTLAGLRHGLHPLICIGDSLQEMQYGVSSDVLSRQLKIALHGVSSDDIGKFWVAYEPCWAIGVDGIPAEPQLVSNLHDFLRKVLVDMFGAKGNDIPLLFGGSVNLGNALDYAKCKNVDGLFIGRAAWETDSFEAIMNDLEQGGIV